MIECSMIICKRLYITVLVILTFVGCFGSNSTNSSSSSSENKDGGRIETSRSINGTKLRIRGVKNEDTCPSCRFRRFANKLLTIKRKGQKKGASKVMSMTEVEFPYSLQRRLDDHLMHIDFNYAATVSDEILLDCQSDVTAKIFRKFPTSVYHWIFDSHTVTADSKRRKLNGGELVIQDARSSDSGVYVCKIEFSPNRKKTAAFFSVVVDSEEIDYLLDTRKDLKYRCPSSVFGLLYTKAFRIWEKDGEPSKKLGKITAKTTTLDTFSPLKTDMTGRWTCVVFDGLTERRWTVAGFNLRVKRAPPMKKQALQFLRKNPSMLIVALVSVGVFFLAFCVLLCYRASEKSQNKAAKTGPIKLEEEEILMEVLEPSDTSLAHIPKKKRKK